MNHKDSKVTKVTHKNSKLRLCFFVSLCLSGSRYELQFMLNRRIHLLLLMGTALLAGCQRGQPTQTATNSASAPRASVALRVAVVNEPELAEAIGRLRGEWQERSGGELSASAVTWKEVSEAKNIEADVVVFPSRYLGDLCLRGWLRPVRGNVLESSDFDADDVFPIVRRDLIQWGGQTMALPLGVADWSVQVDGRPGVSLLAESAAAALASGREDVLFDSETMRSRITEQAFVDALARLAASNTNSGQSAASPKAPGPIAVIGLDDRLVAVTSTSRNAASAFSLAAWLARADTSSQFARAGSGALPVRISMASSGAWYVPELAVGERSELGNTLSAALSSQQCLLIPRVPGVDEYMAALDEAVKAAVVDKVPAQQALKTAAERWEKITDAHGRDPQRQAYLKHLGISAP